MFASKSAHFLPNNLPLKRMGNFTGWLKLDEGHSVWLERPEAYSFGLERLTSSKWL
jgi:hypothetical protein